LYKLIQTVRALPLPTGAHAETADNQPSSPPSFQTINAAASASPPDQKAHSDPARHPPPPRETMTCGPLPKHGPGVSPSPLSIGHVPSSRSIPRIRVRISTTSGHLRKRKNKKAITSGTRLIDTPLAARVHVPPARLASSSRRVLEQ
jgi:hypothetical protein